MRIKYKRQTKVDLSLCARLHRCNATNAVLRSAMASAKRASLNFANTDIHENIANRTLQEAPSRAATSTALFKSKHRHDCYWQFVWYHYQENVCRSTFGNSSRRMVGGHIATQRIPARSQTLTSEKTQRCSSLKNSQAQPCPCCLPVLREHVLTLSHAHTCLEREITSSQPTIPSN